MDINFILSHDLEELKSLQPADWSDIIPDLEYYIRSDFCNPIKVSLENRIAGIGVSIIYDTTAWLAHIIVDPVFRNRGIGYQIVEELLTSLKNTPVETCLLTATELGKPVYIKAGFGEVTEYVFMKREMPWNEQPVSGNVKDYHEKYRGQLLQLDRQVTGENRERLLVDFLNTAKIYATDNTLLGYYIPGLKEGPIIAETPEAGLELMRIKCSTAERIVLPADNLTGIDFLRQNGYDQSSTKGTRMILGKDINWEPSKIFSRIGGNFG